MMTVERRKMIKNMTKYKPVNSELGAITMMLVVMALTAGGLLLLLRG